MPSTWSKYRFSIESGPGGRFVIVDIGDIIRRHKLTGESLASSSDLLLAQRHANELLAAALKRVGLPFG